MEDLCESLGSAVRSAADPIVGVLSSKLAVPEGASVLDQSVRGSSLGTDSQGLSFRGWINAIGEQFPGPPVPLPCPLERNVWISPESDCLLLAGKPVVVSPVSPTSRGD